MSKDMLSIYPEDIHTHIQMSVVVRHNALSKFQGRSSENITHCTHRWKTELKDLNNQKKKNV